MTYLSYNLPDELAHYFKEQNTRCTVFDGREIIITVKNDPYDLDVVSLFFITYGFFNDEPFLVVTYKNKIWQQTVQFDDNGDRLIISPSNYSGFCSNIINESYMSTTTNILNILQSSSDILCTNAHVDDINRSIDNYIVNHPFVCSNNSNTLVHSNNSLIYNVHTNSDTQLNNSKNHINHQLSYHSYLSLNNKSNDSVNNKSNDSFNNDSNDTDISSNDSINNDPNNSINNDPNNPIKNDPNNSINNDPNNSINNDPNNSINNDPNNSINNDPNNSINNECNETDISSNYSFNNECNDTDISSNNFIDKTNSTNILSDFKLDKKTIYKIGKYTVYGLSATAAFIYLKNYLAPKIDN